MGNSVKGKVKVKVSSKPKRKPVRPGPIPSSGVLSKKVIIVVNGRKKSK